MSKQINNNLKKNKFMNKIFKVKERDVRVITYNSYNDLKNYCYKLIAEPSGNYIGCVENINEDNESQEYVVPKIRKIVEKAINDGEFDDD